MTFEEFKKEFEIWRKIETPEILDICNKQYQQHLMIQQDNNYFEPVIEETRTDSIGIYYNKLNNILGIDNLSENQIHILIRPSFTPESLLTIEYSEETFFVYLKVLSTNYWLYIYSEAISLNIEMTKTKVKIDKELGTELFNLLNNIISEAREPNVQMFTLDGTEYQLHKITKSKRQIVKKVYSEENSKSGQVINILNMLVDNINSIDSKVTTYIRDKIRKVKY